MSNLNPVIQISVRRLECVECGAEANATCDCNKPYVRAAQRVAEYDKANPGRSTRRVAADLGVSQPVVVEARKSGDRHLSPDVVTGRDGKQYPARRDSSRDDTGPDFGPQTTGIDPPAARRRSFLYRASEAVRYAEFDSFNGLEIDDELRKAVQRAANAWNKLLQQLEALS